MRFWSAPTGLFPYSFDEVVSVFWDRYPNSFAKHIVSEDVLERKVTENTIVTKKLIVKQGSSFLKRVPRWLSRMTEIRTVPVIEESIYDRRTRTLTTYTRNVSHNELFAMHERCIYRPNLVSELLISV
ncbi:PRELI-like family protein [Oesophagostomum dentatum]|uniref:PRELI-like family protein n=1 Tax=Oesophagostomum dentatum TaxID=61180 RepID=A0A0B1SAJ8_OESDE|nr:PRELI-like family protein [Oesophagostomum dentatum]